MVCLPSVLPPPGHRSHAPGACGDEQLAFPVALAFGAPTAGQQLDMGTLFNELLAVVDQTMEPTRVSFWLRPSPAGSSGTAGSEARPTQWAY